MKIEIKGELRILTAENGYITQNTDSVIDNRIFVKQKMLLPAETESDYKEVESNEEEQMNAELEELQNQVPEKISSRQLRSQLILQGFNLETIEQALNQLPEPNRSLAKVDWEYATNFYRNNPMIVAVGQLLNLTNEQIDEIFRQGEKL